MVVSELRQNFVEYFEFVRHSDVPYGTLVSKLEEDGVWDEDAADLVVVAFATALQRPILLFTAHIGIQFVAPFHPSESALKLDPLTLLLLNDHYDALLANNELKRVQPAPPHVLKPSSRLTAVEKLGKHGVPVTRNPWSAAERNLLESIREHVGRNKSSAIQKTWNEVVATGKYNGEDCVGIRPRGSSHLKSQAQYMDKQEKEQHVPKERHSARLAKKARTDPGPAATREDCPSREAPESQVANQPEAVEASVTYEPSAMNPNGDHNPPVSQPQVNAIWHPAILPPMNVDPLPFQPCDKQPFQPFDQQPLPLDPEPTFQFMVQRPENDYWPQ